MYPLGCYCWSCFHLRKFQEFNSPRALNPLIQKKKKRDRVVVSPGEFLPLRFDETPTRAVRLRGVLLFLFLRGALLSEKIEAFLGSSYFLHSKEEGSTRVKTHLFFFLWKMCDSESCCFIPKASGNSLFVRKRKAVRSSSTLFVVFTSNAILLTTTTTTTTTSKKSADAKRWKQLCLRD